MQIQIKNKDNYIHYFITGFLLIGASYGVLGGHIVLILYSIFAILLLIYWRTY